MDLSDNDPVLLACQRDAERQQQDERRRHEREWDQRFAQEFLLIKYDEELLTICDRQLTKGTLAVYAGRLARFVKWCGEYELTPLPASAEVVAMYLDAELESGASYSSLKTDHAAIGYGHRLAGLPDPTHVPEEIDPRARPFPLAVLKRAHAQHKVKQEKSSTGDQTDGEGRPI
jgi:hypothetical protein